MALIVVSVNYRLSYVVPGQFLDILRILHKKLSLVFAEKASISVLHYKSVPSKITVAQHLLCGVRNE